MPSARIILVLLATLSLPIDLRGQQIQVEGNFLDSAARVGEEVRYTLSARYPRGLNLLFPDSTYSYGGFEYLRREYFPTRSSAIQSFDSVIYYLTTFELDSLQILTLPVYHIRAKDSAAVYPEPSALQLLHSISEIPQKPELRSDTGLWSLRLQFNYPYLLAGLAVVFMAAVLVYVLFGRRIVRWLMVYRLRKAHERFTRRFFGTMQAIDANEQSVSATEALSIWKKYLERLESRPITKLTSTEIHTVFSNDSVRDHLKAIDRVLYGNYSDDRLFQRCDELLQFATHRFRMKVESVNKARNPDEHR